LRDLGGKVSKVLRLPFGTPWIKHPEDDDFVQAGDRYRVMSAEEKQRLVAKIAAGLPKVRREEIITRSISHFRRADPDYGERAENAVKALRDRR
jgi:catalase